MSKTEKTKAAKPKARQSFSPEGYNAKQAGKLWTWADLPCHMSDLRKRPGLFSDAVRSFQRSKGLTADGKLGPKTLAAIRSVWPSAPPAADTKPDQKPGEDDDAGDG